MMQKILLLSVLAAVPGALAFSTTHHHRRRRRNTLALNVGATWEDFDDCDFAMHQAEACANSESCSLEQAQLCLDEILHIQKGCVGSGVLSTSTVCEDVDVTADVVAKLRQKIELEGKRLAPLKAGLNLVNVVLGVAVVSMILHGVAANPNVPVDSGAGGAAVAPLFFQEWIWAARDGYLPLLFSEWIKNGGLMVDASAFDMKAVPITPQEWVWATQNGGFGHMLEENMRYGGLLVDSSYDSETVPMTMQEAWWALSGGYGGTAMEHFFRNGGL